VLSEKIRGFFANPTISSFGVLGVTGVIAVFSEVGLAVLFETSCKIFKKFLK
jgi:hypothetical protein